MKSPQSQPLSRHWYDLRRSLWSMVAFLASSAVLIWLVSDRFLIPALVASQDASDGQKRELAAFARLLLAIVLFILCVGILMIFRVRRFFFPRRHSTPQKTEYIDAWAEAGRRLNERDDPTDPGAESNR
jgi:H+/Cl- antiporter ClcA